MKKFLLETMFINGVRIEVFGFAEDKPYFEVRYWIGDRYHTKFMVKGDHILRRIEETAKQFQKLAKLG